jgi:hypothetical protein
MDAEQIYCVWEYLRGSSEAGYHIYRPKCDHGSTVNCRELKKDGDIDPCCGLKIKIKLA